MTDVNPYRPPSQPQPNHDRLRQQTGRQRNRCFTAIGKVLFIGMTGNYLLLSVLASIDENEVWWMASIHSVGAAAIATVSWRLYRYWSATANGE